ncbi:hypothetical protein APS56_13205 [Pseudalgibacter alginicilyticus]|uniref:AsmA domain-containing protein n=1 Tax=Pseudalgibacter alginicilyticus TaxID=1736674 RepID=A0A0N7HYS0_9FLAO|nr:AsmA-like C-terminal region-containing protein [Pseudalgibacter alginicilyticus]ALJ06030.1 hypothetical protein APS56_13205 [Pseudalgibacter alginicilyticus]
MKKILKISGITLLTILVLLIGIPFAFHGQIQDMVKRFINENLNAQVEFSDVSLSFIRSFPQAYVGVNNLVITNFEPFKDETFISAKNISFTMSIKELFKAASEGPIVINSIYLDEALLTLKTDALGNNNYDITKDNETETTSESDGSFAFDIEDYKISNSAVTYVDEISKMAIHITEFNHEGKGAFSTEISELDTKSEANVSFIFDNTNYLNSNPIKLDAKIGLDLVNSKYTFKENKALINELPIEFQGYVQLLENGQDIDISFENPESSFKSFLAVIPKAYSKDIENVETTGDFKIKGIVKGILTEETIPTLNISFQSNNASFRYPDLPKGIENIVIDTEIKNETGFMKDTYVNINTLNFKIDQDVFKSSIALKNLTENMFVSANIDGVLNLGNINKAYPIELENDLTGILKAKLNANFDMKAIETNAYERIKSSGSASISDFAYSSETFANPIQISETVMAFNPTTVSLSNFKAKTGESDLSGTGTINNLLGFLLNDGTLQGHFTLNSNLFKINDFMSEDEVQTADNTTATSSESLKIPAFLDCTINVNAKTVVYDNLNLSDVSGTLLIKDQQATLQNMKSSIFDGALSIAGDVSTKGETPTFNMSLSADGFDIAKSFKDLELLQSLAPIANIIQGKINTNINLSGDLDEEFAPNLNTISGNALAELLATRIGDNQSELMNKLEGTLNFIDFSKLDLKDLKTKLEFANGKVSVTPFDLKYQDIGITISGAHSFDQTMDYSAVFNVPAKYLGSDVNRLIGKINDNEVNQITIPVTANIGGSFTNPSVKTDLTSGVSNLTKQLIEIEKQKLLNEGKDKVSNLIGNMIGSNQTKTDSLKQEQNNAVKNVLEGLLSGSKTKTDTTSTETSTKTNTTQNTVKNVLGGLLNKNKKDTVN